MYWSSYDNIQQTGIIGLGIKIKHLIIFFLQFSSYFLCDLLRTRLIMMRSISWGCYVAKLSHSQSGFNSVEWTNINPPQVIFPGNTCPGYNYNSSWAMFCHNPSWTTTSTVVGFGMEITFITTPSQPQNPPTQTQ